MHTEHVSEDETTADRHTAATEEYTAASADYEAAAMAGDPAAMSAADARLAAAHDAYGESLSALVAEEASDLTAPRRPSVRRAELPSFEEMLGHPWAQPDSDGPLVGTVVYYQAVAQTAGLPVNFASTGFEVPTNTRPAVIASSAREVAWRSLFADTGARPLAHR